MTDLKPRTREQMEAEIASYAIELAATALRLAAGGGKGEALIVLAQNLAEVCAEHRSDVSRHEASALIEREVAAAADTDSVMTPALRLAAARLLQQLNHEVKAKAALIEAIPGWIRREA